jgi:hypothetical protein
MASKALPSPEVLRQLLRYEPETGKLFWKERGPEWFDATATRSAAHSCAVWNSRYAGREAFTAGNGRSYRQWSILRRHHCAHRVIWAMQTGAWPDAEIDHVDCDGHNNAWANLRRADRCQNQYNTRAHADSASGIKGLWRRPDGKWRVRLCARYVDHEVGVYGCVTAARIAYAKASAKLHGAFGRTA